MKKSDNSNIYNTLLKIITVLFLIFLSACGSEITVEEKFSRVQEDQFFIEAKKFGLTFLTQTQTIKAGEQIDLFFIDTIDSTNN